MANEQVFRDFYDHVFALLDGDAAITAIVTNSENIRPSNDVEEPKAGPVIHYSWTSGQFNRRQKKGSGTFNITAAHPSDKTAALDLLELIREKMTPRALTDADTKVIVHKFNENLALIDEGVGPSSRFEAVTAFDVRVVVKPTP